MMLFSRIRSLASNLFSRDKVERELNAEVNSYLDQLIDEKIAGGLSPHDARRKALLELEGAEQIKENVREVRAGAVIRSSCTS